MAITVDVGKIKLVWRGTYAGGTAYTPDDVVEYNDGSTVSAYINISDSTGQVPSTTGTVNTTYWNLVAKGASAASSGTVNGQIQLKESTGFGYSTLLFYDSSTTRLGVATDSPNQTLDVNGNVNILTDLNVVGTSTVGILTVTDTLSVAPVKEKTIVGTTANGTSDLNVLDGTVYLFDSASGGTWTHNIRGNGSTTLNACLSVGQAITVTVISKQTSTSNFTDAITIDGSGVTEYWLSGAVPTSGVSDSNNYDAYIWNIVKTSTSPSYVVFATQTPFGN